MNLPGDLARWFSAWLHDLLSWKREEERVPSSLSPLPSVAATTSQWPAVDRLFAYWESLDLQWPVGATEAQLADWERKQEVTLPPDFRIFLARYGGEAYEFTDNDFNSFWPLHHLERCAARDSHPDSPHVYFTFADWSIEACVWSIGLSASSTALNPVINGTGSVSGHRVAGSFSEFIELYLTCPAGLSTA